MGLEPDLSMEPPLISLSVAGFLVQHTGMIAS
jgi:hypothetical protein